MFGYERQSHYVHRPANANLAKDTKYFVVVEATSGHRQTDMD